jgi:hypothetical protein
MTLSTLTKYRDPHDYDIYSIRQSWITRLAFLGRLNGEDLVLIGVTTEMEPESISYGLATSNQVGALESTLGKSVAAIMSGGESVTATVRLSPPPKQIVDLAPLRTEGHIVKCQVRTDEDRDAMEQQNLCSERFVEMRKGVLDLRAPAWRIAEMKHRSHWPAWLPSDVRDIIREHSRAWLELPNAPDGFKETPAIPPLLPHFGQTSHPVMPQCPR